MRICSVRMSPAASTRVSLSCFVIIFPHCGWRERRTTERERERKREQSDCPLAVAKELAVTTLHSDLLNFRRARAKRLREMESETVEGLVSAGNAPVFSLISPVGRRFFPFLLRVAVFQQDSVKTCGAFRALKNHWKIERE